MCLGIGTVDAAERSEGSGTGSKHRTLTHRASAEDDYLTKASSKRRHTNRKALKKTARTGDRSAKRSVAQTDDASPQLDVYVQVELPSRGIENDNAPMSADDDQSGILLGTENENNGATTNPTSPPNNIEN